MIRTDHRIRRRMEHLQRLPFYVVYGCLATIHATTQNKFVLLLLLFAYPLLLLPTTYVACKWADLIGSYDVHLRREYSRLRSGHNARTS